MQLPPPSTFLLPPASAGSAQALLLLSALITPFFFPSHSPFSAHSPVDTLGGWSRTCCCNISCWEVHRERESRRIMLRPAGASRRCTANRSTGTRSGALGHARAAQGAGEVRACMTGGSMSQPGNGASPGSWACRKKQTEISYLYLIRF